MTKYQIDLLIAYIEIRSQLSAAGGMMATLGVTPQHAKEAEYAFRESFSDDMQPPRRHDTLTTQQRLDMIAEIFDHARVSKREISASERSRIWQLAAGTYR